MKIKQADFSYQGYLRSVQHDGHALEKSQKHLLTNFYKDRINLLNDPTHLFFIADFVKMNHTMFSQCAHLVVGHSAMQFMIDGLEFSRAIIDPAYFNVYNAKVFPAIIKTLKAYPQHQHHNLNFSFNVRLRCERKNWINIMQHCRNITSQTTGMPLYCLGTITDITQFKADRLMNYKAEWRNLQNGYYQFIEERRFCVDERDKLLSKTEKKILNYIADGLSSKMIAEKLNISEHTIDNHRQHMLIKTETTNTANLVAFSIKNGLI